jgi:hypothetical protein
MKALLIIAVVAVSIAPGCAGTTIAPSTLAGQWSHVRATNEPPGFFRQFTLTVADTTVSGSGTFQGEAGPSGTLDVTGSVKGGQVHLDFVFHQTTPAPAPDYQGHFDGQLASASDLVGTLTIGSLAPAPEHFAKN